MAKRKYGVEDAPMKMTDANVDDSIEVRVTQMNGTELVMFARLGWMIKDVKHRLHQEMGMALEGQQLVASGRVLKDTELLSDVASVHETKLCLTVVLCQVLRLEDLQLSQTQRDGEHGCDDYLIVVTHIPSGQVLEWKYCCYHPLAFPIQPDPVQGLRVEKENGCLSVVWEWSENSHDLASPGAIFRMPGLALNGEKLTWSGKCTKEQKKLPAKLLPEPPELLLSETEEVFLKDCRIHTSGAVVVQHVPTGSEVRYEENTDTRAFIQEELTQAGGYVRVQFRERWKYNRDMGIRDHCYFVKLSSGQLQWAEKPPRFY